MPHIFSKVTDGKASILFLATLTLFLVISFFIPSFHGLEVRSATHPVAEVCTNGGIGNGGACFSGTQCLSGFCPGGNGLTCGSGSCQGGDISSNIIAPPGQTAEDGVPSGGEDGPPAPGGGPSCTLFTPAPPSSISGNFSSGDIINITIHAPSQNGTGDYHHVKVVLASQDISQVGDPLAQSMMVPFSSEAIQTTYTINSFGQAVKIGVRNFDSCQNIYGPWITQVVALPTYVCTGTPASNSTMCALDDTNLAQNTPWSLAPSCTVAIKCERQCSSGFTNGDQQCVPVTQNESGNVYGYAWSSNVGWVKMNSCPDVNPFNGLPDVSGCDTAQYGVKVNNANNNNLPPTIPAGGGTLSGHAWNEKIGWVRFGGWSGFPSAIEAPGTVASNAELVSVTSLGGLFQGWARALKGGITPGFDGWLSLSGANYYSGPIAGTAGITYHVPTARLMGWAWGGNVLGWVSFSGDNSSAQGSYQVTYGAPSNIFDYTLKRVPSGTIVVEQSATEDVTITRTLTSGIPQLVTLTTEVSGGNANQDKPTAIITTNQNCEPTCSSNLAIEASANVPFGSYTVGVVGQPLNKTLQIPVTVVAPNAPALSVECTVEGIPPYYVNKPLVWKATVIGGIEPYFFAWSGTDSFSCASGAVCQSVNGNVSNAQNVYSTTGIKSANVSVTDSRGTIAGSCPKSAQATVVVQPNIIEF